MKSNLYPTIKTSAVAVLMLLFITSAKAQGALYAAHKPSSAKRTAQVVRMVDAAVRIVARTENRVGLSWCPFGGAVSHYVLERSVDGKSYQEAGVFFTGEWGEEPDYSFTDKLKRSYSGPLFYRLRVVGQDGTEVYTLPVITEEVLK